MAGFLFALTFHLLESTIGQVGGIDLATETEIGLAVLGSSVGLAGLSLVFLGFAISTYRSFPADTGDKILRPYVGAAAAMTLAFFMGMVTALLALLWLIHDTSKLYGIFVYLFIAQMALSSLSAFFITNLSLRSKLWL